MGPAVVARSAIFTLNTSAVVSADSKLFWPPAVNYVIVLRQRGLRLQSARMPLRLHPISHPNLKPYQAHATSSRVCAHVGTQLGSTS